MNMSLEHLWSTMGWFAKGIVITLIFMSILVAMIAIRKLIELGRSRRATVAFSPKFSKALAEENFQEAAKLVEAYPKSHLAVAFRRVFPSLEFHSADWQLTAVEIGSGGLAAISAGIAEALITTAIGLGAALPGVWLYNYFINRIDFISMETTMASKEFMDFLLRYEARLHRKAGKTVTGDTEAAKMVGASSGGAAGRH